MQLLYESKYQILLHSEKDQMFVSEWKPDTALITDETHLVELHKLFSFFRKVGPLRYYCDISNFNIKLSKEAQEFAANLFKNDRAKYCAIVTNKAEVAPSVEGVIEELEATTDDLFVRYFQDKTIAMNWLLACGNNPIILKNSQAALNQQ